MKTRVRGEGEAASTDKLFSQTVALEQKIAEVERFCGKLALENEILRKGWLDTAPKDTS
jgi:hypothetical protein